MSHDRWDDGDIGCVQPVDLHLKIIDEMLTKDAFSARELEPAKLAGIQCYPKLFIGTRSIQMEGGLPFVSRKTEQ